MKEMVSLAEAKPVEESWLADVAVYPAGEKLSLIQARSTRATSLVHTTYAELLTQCREFKTLDEHLSAFCLQKQLSGTPISAEAMQGLRAKFQQLTQGGYLIPQSQIRRLFEETGKQVSPAHITTIGIPTCNRVETVQRGLTSYLEHCQRFGRSVEFVVMDDSPSPSMRKAYREMLHGLKQQYGMSIAYAGVEEKMAYVQKLSEVGKIPAEIVSWACLGDHTYGERTTGANRNALLLHTVNECIFSSDDDLVCRVAASPGFQTGLTLWSYEDPSQYWYYSDRESALKAVPAVEQDILALHEQWLGQDPKVSGARYSSAEQISIELAEPGALRRFALGTGKTALTLHGVIGDACFLTNDILFFNPTESLKRLTNSEEVYRSAQISREMAQVANQLTITANFHPLIGMYMGGLDNRELLPPFTPVGRSQDSAFGHIFGTCFPDAYAVHLPWTLLHAPLETRLYLEPILNEGGCVTRDIPFYEWLPWCIERFRLDQISTPTDHLSQLGQFLEHIGRLPTPAFEEFARHLLWQNDGEAISYLEQRLHTDEVQLASYKRDVEAYNARARQTMLLPVKRRLLGGAELVQRSLVQFAQILFWWPAMIETARLLRAEGCRIAQPL